MGSDSTGRKDFVCMVIGHENVFPVQTLLNLINKAEESSVVVVAAENPLTDTPKIAIKPNPPIEVLKIQPAIFRGNPDRNVFKGQKRKNQRSKFR